MNKKFKIMALSLALVSVFTVNTLAYAKEGEVEREFTIEVDSPLVEEKDTTSEDISKGFTVDVEKPTVEKEKTTKVPKKDVFKKKKQGNSKGTVTENVGVDNKPYPIRREIKENTDTS